MDFVFAKRLEGLDLSVPGRRVAALKDMASLLAPLKHSVLLDDYATRLADTLGLEVEDTKRAIREAPVQDADDERPRRCGGPQGAAGGSGARRQAAAPARKSRAQAGSSWDDGVPMDAYDAVPVTEDGGWGGPPEYGAPLEAAPAGVVPEAPSILSGGRALEGREMPDERKLSVVMDTVELGSCRRRIRQIRVRLRSLSKGAPDGESEGLFEEATSLQLRVNELVRKLSSSSND